MTIPPPPSNSEYPYGNTPGNPPPGGGQPPYGAPYPGGPESAGPKTDAVSIAALITGLSCCASLVGIILGFIGLSRTKNGQRKGRWAAITGIVAGFIGTAVLAVAVIGGVWIFNNAVTPGNAEVGQCVDVDTDGDDVSMFKKDCTEDHDAEIVGVEEVDSDNREAIETGMDAYCAEVIDQADLETLLSRDDIDFKAVIEDPSDIETGDHLVCYVEAKSGKLDEKILD